MVQIQLVWAWFTAKAVEVREQDPDRGEIVNTSIVIGLLAAGAVVVAGILVAKAVTSANKINP
jgi:ABC-type spermidine/putrescine transport system permease subunit II